MGNIAFNIAKGKWAQYAELGGANDAFIAVPLETTGLESDATLKDYDTLDAILAAANNEQSTMGRKTLASVTVAVNDTTDVMAVDCADITWTAATGNAVSALLVCYDSDTTGGTDANIIPLFKFDFVVTPAGGDITAQVHASGLASAA